MMTDREAMKLALEALVDFGWHIENCPQFPTWAEPKKHPPCTCGYDTAITALRQALEQPSDIEAAVRAENEACSEIAYSMVYSEDEAEEIAKAIRARVK